MLLGLFFQDIDVYDKNSDNLKWVARRGRFFGAISVAVEIKFIDGHKKT